ncbi:single-stranded DNA-binding protein [Gottfriedia acidiceleris]|uniref:single-stranded DNA-binding protein n=1 Tax=Gottfriedia acidiceleris TaxID=371036 RepID=UPI00339A094D
MYQKQVVVGRLTRDPESKTYGENTVCRFAVAVDDGFGDKKTTDFFNVSAWGKMGENVQKFTKKGSVVLIEGKMKSSKKENVTYWELRADEVKFLSSNNDGGQGNGGQQQQQSQQMQQQYQQPQYQQQMTQQPQMTQQMQYQQNQFAPQQQQQMQYAQQVQQQQGGFMPIPDDQLPF